MTESRTGKTGVLCVGRAYCDLIFTDVPRMPEMGTEVFAGGLAIHAGGGAPITAAHLAALGRPSALAAFLPRNPFGPLVGDQLMAAGVDLSLCRVADTETDPQVTMAITGQGDRAFVTRRSGSAAPRLTGDRLVRMDIAHIHIGELSTLIEMPGLVALARENGMTVSLDCAWDETIATEKAAPLIAMIDVFLPNEAEAGWLREGGAHEPFAPLTVVKQGALGATAIVGGEQTSVSTQKIDPVDATGAGDAFNAGFLNRWLSGAPLTECLASGNAAGAKAISRRGGFAVPSHQISKQGDIAIQR